MSGASGLVVSCGVRLAEVGFSEIRKPQVEQVWKPQAGGFAKDTDRGPDQDSNFVRAPYTKKPLSRFWSRFRIYPNRSRQAPPSPEKDVTIFVTRQDRNGKETMGMYRLNGTLQGLGIAN